MATKRAPAAAAAAPTPPPRPPYMLIEQIQVKGYKSLVDATLHVRPLTLLAGTNSSGKSSIMQPLLLLKQTMEASYNPAGALVLSGAHVQAETAGELVSKIDGSESEQFAILLKGTDAYQELIDGMEEPPRGKTQIELSYRNSDTNFFIAFQSFTFLQEEVRLTPSIEWKELKKILPISFRNRFLISELSNASATVTQANGFLQLQLNDSKSRHFANIWLSLEIETTLAIMIHIPGLRGKPERSYPATTFQDQIKGTFDLYAAGTISQWQQQGDTEKLAQLNDYLRRLGLTNTVAATVKNANEIELSVSRLPAGSKGRPRKADLVNIADVGIGVSQVLPILVALLAAQEGQLVYVEQPELHLHPRAQVVMAELLAEAANRGVRVIVETHSSLLLLTVQTLVAEGRIKPADVGLHWFSRDAKGATQVTLAEVDENGAYGDWPEDFGDVELRAQSAYLNANTSRQPFQPTGNE